MSGDAGPAPPAAFLGSARWLALEVFVVFAERVFRYPHGDAAGRARAVEHGRALGVPEAQLDWPG